MKVRAWGPLAALVLLFVAAITGVWVSSNQPKKNRPQIDTQQKSAESVGGKNKSQNAIAKEQPSSSEKAKGAGDHAENGEVWGVKRGEWLLFFATLGLWFATWRLVKGAEETARKQLRAYIDVEPAGIGPYHGKTYLIGHIIIKNLGSIPAKNVSIFSTVEWSGDGERPYFDPGAVKRTTTTLAPRAEMKFGTYKGIEPFRIGTAKDGNIHEWAGYLYVWGVVTYTDEFGTDGRTHFCHRYPTAMRTTRDRILVEYARRHEAGGNQAT